MLHTHFVEQQIQRTSAYGVNVSLAVVRILPGGGNCSSTTYLVYSMHICN